MSIRSSLPAKLAGIASLVMLVGTAVSSVCADTTVSAARETSSSTRTTTAATSTARDARELSRKAQATAEPCQVMERPKHTIRKCRCDTGDLAGVTSIDAAEIIRLLLGGQTCQASGGRR